MRRVAITGPESTGKTTLFEALRKRFRARFAAEYAREYLEGIKGKTVLEDLHHIAREQFSRIMQDTPEKLLIADTDLSVMKIWVEDKFQRDTLIDELFGKQEIDLFLLCAPDLPWVADPLREDPDRREELFLRYRSLLEKTGARFTIIRGEDRVEQAVAAIRALPK